MGDEAGVLSRVLKSSELMRDVSPLNARVGDRCCLTQAEIQDGMELQLWEASFASPLQMEIVEDCDAIHFTYVIQGGAQVEIVNRRCGMGMEALPGTGVMHSCPGERGRFRQAGEYSSLVAMVRPEVFLGWSEVSTTSLRDVLSRGQCLIGGIRGRELHTQARHLHRALKRVSATDESRQAPGHDLHLQIQGLGFIAAFLDCVRREGEAGRHLSRDDRQRLGKARELLMADLTQAPTLLHLAKESGLGLSKLKRGFQILYGSSAYALFLQERMLEARRRLRRGGASVTEVAVDMGYVNVSHFAAAFRRQFGVSPAAVAKGSDR